MIRIERPPEPPTILQESGKRETNKNCKIYDCHPENFRDGSAKFEFDKDIYGHISVKNALSCAQHGKCCYCESRFGGTSYGAVEHFRPKGSVQQCRKQSMEYPGYYWLAYAWTNLLVSCEKCNTTHKRSQFPLADESARARNHHDDVDAEQPLFIDPAQEDPRQHIRFRGAAVFSITVRGKETIEGVGLRRHALVEARREKLDNLRVFRDMVEISELGGSVEADLVERARERLKKALEPNAEYSAMAQDLLDAD